MLTALNNLPSAVAELMVSTTEKTILITIVIHLGEPRPWCSLQSFATMARRLADRRGIRSSTYVMLDVITRVQQRALGSHM